MHTLKPNRRVFVLRPTIWTGAFAAFLGMLALIVAPLLGVSAIYVAVGWLPLALILVGLTMWTRTVRYNKTQYTFHADRIVLNTGGLFSEHSVDLQFKNVTQIEMKLPYLEHRFYQTGYITVKAAGSGHTEVVLSAIDAPREHYERLNDALKANGFGMSREQLVQQEKPGSLACLMEVGGLLVPALGLMWAVFIPLVQFFFHAIDSIREAGVIEIVHPRSGELVPVAVDGAGASLQLSIIVFAVTMVVLAIGCTIGFVLSYMNLKARKYTLFNDVIEYESGFLTEVYSSIPFENLADVQLSQPFIKRALGISDVVVSCQGGGADIRFNSMARGDLFKKNLETLLVARETTPEEVQPVSAIEPMVLGKPGERVTSAPVSPASTASPISPARQLPPSTYKMSPLRATLELAEFVTFLLFLAGVTGLIVIVGTGVLGIENFPTIWIPPALIVFASMAVPRFKNVIAAYVTTYQVNGHKVTYQYALFSREDREFTNDKITAVTVKQGILDRLLNTATVSFRSIGTTESIDFKHLPDGMKVASSILRRLGMNEPQPARCVHASYSPGKLLISDQPFLFMLLFVTLAGLILSAVHEIRWLWMVLGSLSGVITIVVHSSLYYPRCRLEFFNTYMRFTGGVLNISQHYFMYKHVKSTTSMRYLLDSEDGVLEWNVGGGVVTSMAFIENVQQLHEELDEILQGKSYSSTESLLDKSVMLETQPELSNSLASLITKSVILFPLLAFLPLTLPLTTMKLRRTRYVVEANRLLVQSGIWFRRRHTILLSRVDHLVTSRGFWNKVFHNGNVGIRTVGSSGTDMAFTHVKDEQALYQRIEEMVKGDTNV